MVIFGLCEWVWKRGPSQRCPLAQPFSVSSASLELLFCPACRLTVAWLWGLPASQLANLSCASLLCAWLPGNTAVWGEQRGQELPDIREARWSVRHSTFSLCRRSIRKSGPWSLPDKIHCPERGGKGGSSTGLRTNNCLSVLCHALKGVSTLALLTLWTGLFCVVGAVLFTVGWWPVLTSIPGFWLLPADNQSCASIRTHHGWKPKMSPAIASLSAGPGLTHLSLNSHEAGVTVIISHGTK